MLDYLKELIDNITIFILTKYMGAGDPFARFITYHYYKKWPFKAVGRVSRVYYSKMAISLKSKDSR